ncbi:MAG TPA: SDR family oxidoreductase [Burkholderiales bacterium]|jgi:NAD(P)-dependent dehydrogenase (short-subunit alcohol dehydrogenase family)
MPFTDRTVVITGASGNLGRSVAKAFAELNARLALLDLRRGDLQDGPNQVFLEADLLNPESVGAAVGKTLERFGRIDVLCNIAGGFRMGSPVHEMKDKDWDFLFGLNARSVVNSARTAVPAMLKGGGGKIVNIGAFAAQRGAANMGPYIASKSAVIRLTETMAAELRERNINVNCVLPTIIDTPENRAAMPDADPRRWVAPQDLAAVIVFLASDAARAIHGAAIPVTGLS